MPRLDGEIVDIAFKPGKNGEYAEVSLQRSGSPYPVKCRAFDSELVQRFRNAQRGMQVGLTVEEQPSTFNGKAITYRNITSIQAYDGDVSVPADGHLVREAQRLGGKLVDVENGTTRSIERQVAAKAATEILVALGRDHLPIETQGDMMEQWSLIADHIDQWIHDPGVAWDSEGG